MYELLAKAELTVEWFLIVVPFEKSRGFRMQTEPAYPIEAGVTPAPIVSFYELDLLLNATPLRDALHGVF